MADTRFKVENGLLAVGGAGSSSRFEHPLTVAANTTIDGDLLLVQGNFTVVGNTIYQGVLNYAADLIPTTNGTLTIGTSTNTYNGHFNTLISHSGIFPLANTVALGNTSRRFEGFVTNINASGTGTITGAATFSNTIVVTGNAQFSNTVAVTGNATFSNTIAATGAATFSNTVTATGAVTTPAVILTNGGLYSNQATVSTTSPTVVDSFPLASATGARYTVTARLAGTSRHAVELLTVHEGTNVLATQYAEIFNTRLGVFDININGANVELTFTPLTAVAHTVRVIRQQIL